MGSLREKIVHAMRSSKHWRGLMVVPGEHASHFEEAVAAATAVVEIFGGTITSGYRNDVVTAALTSSGKSKGRSAHQIAAAFDWWGHRAERRAIMAAALGRQLPFEFDEVLIGKNHIHCGLRLPLTGGRRFRVGYEARKGARGGDIRSMEDVERWLPVFWEDEKGPLPPSRREYTEALSLSARAIAPMHRTVADAVQEAAPLLEDYRVHAGLPGVHLPTARLVIAAVPGTGASASAQAVFPAFTEVKTKDAASTAFAAAASSDLPLPFIVAPEHVPYLDLPRQATGRSERVVVVVAPQGPPAFASRNVIAGTRGGTASVLHPGRWSDLGAFLIGQGLISRP